MTAASAHGPVPGPVDSLEVRWILPGPLAAVTSEWFARFPAVTESRQDAYLLRPALPGLSVKLRNGSSLDVKSYLGDAGLLDLAGRARGRLEYWRKWSFPYGRPGPSGDPGPGEPHGAGAGWAAVRKTRRNSSFPLANGMSGAGGAVCMAELTEAETGGEPWWSVGFEATGSPGHLRGALQHAAGRVFTEPLPAGTELDLGNCRSYAQWLGQRLLGPAPAPPVRPSPPGAFQRAVGAVGPVEPVEFGHVGV